jgi:hypothetical protein
MGKRALLIAAAGYSILALLLTWPLILHLTSALPHDAEDPLLSTTILWWNAHVLPLSRRWMDGFFYYPAGGALALSDHRLGLSLVASPLLWLGLGPVTVYNITFLATYPLSAIAAHALAFSLTRRHDASIVCALAFGFNPFRVEHLPHLELLAAFAMPAALWTLHRYIDTRRPAWIVAFAAALIVQGLCATYYLLFFLVFVALWIAWFVRPREWRIAAAIGAACLVSGAILSPVAIEYLRVHQRFGLSRTYREILLYSADVTSLVTAPALIALWGWTAPLNGNETRIFPGLTIMILVLLGVLDALRRGPAHRRSILLSRIALAVGCIFAAIAFLTAVRGGWAFNLGFVSLSSRVIYKPLSIAMLAFTASAALSIRGRDAISRRSPFAFYVVAAMVLYLCSMGPEPAFLGHQVLYRPPYKWLMNLPVFDVGVRAPARFAMPAALALSVAAALAFSRLSTLNSPRTRVALGFVMAGILADAWVPRIPLGSVPDPWNPPAAGGFAAVLELPLGGIGDDVDAMYHTLRHHLPTVNGYSGYAPPHYAALRSALEDRDLTALDGLASYGSLLVAADKSRNGDWPGFVRRIPGAAAISEDGRWAFFKIPGKASAPSVCGTATLPIAAAADNHGAIPVSTITDGSTSTLWTLARPQQAGDRLTIDLGRASYPCEVVLHQDVSSTYPRELSVATSLDAVAWTTAFSGKTGGLAIRGALASPRSPTLTIPLGSPSARFIRFQIERTLERDWWVVSDVSVAGAR